MTNSKSTTGSGGHRPREPLRSTTDTSFQGGVSPTAQQAKPPPGAYGNPVVPPHGRRQKLRRAPARHHTRPTRTPKSHARPPPGPRAVRHGSGQPPAKHACAGNGDGRRPLRPRIARGSRQPYGLSLVPAGMRWLRGRRPKQGKRACLAGVCPSQRAHSGRAGWCPASARTRGRAVRAGWCLACRCALRFAAVHGATLLGSAHPATSLPARRWAHPSLRTRTVPSGARRSPRGSSRDSGADASPADRPHHSGATGATSKRPSLRARGLPVGSGTHP